MIKILLFALILMSAVHAEKPKVLVRTFTTNALGDLFMKGFYDAFCSEISSSSSKYTLTDESLFFEHINNLDSSDNCHTDICTMNYGEVLGINFIIKGEVGVLKDAFTFNFKLLDVEKKQVINQSYTVIEDKFPNIIQDSIPSLLKKVLLIKPDRIMAKNPIIELHPGSSIPVELNFSPKYSDKHVIMSSKATNIAITGNEILANEIGNATVVIRSKVDSSVTTTVQVLVKEDKEKFVLPTTNIIRGVLSAVSVGTLVGGIVVNSSIGDSQTDYENAKNLSNLDAAKNDADSKETTRNILYTLSALSAAGIVLTFTF